MCSSSSGRTSPSRAASSIPPLSALLPAHPTRCGPAFPAPDPQAAGCAAPRGHRGSTAQSRTLQLTPPPPHRRRQLRYNCERVDLRGGDPVERHRRYRELQARQASSSAPAPLISRSSARPHGARIPLISCSNSESALAKKRYTARRRNSDGTARAPANRIPAQLGIGAPAGVGSARAGQSARFVDGICEPVGHARRQVSRCAGQGLRRTEVRTRGGWPRPCHLREG